MKSPSPEPPSNPVESPTSTGDPALPEVVSPEHLRAQIHVWVLYFVLVSLGVAGLLGLDALLTPRPAP